MRSVLMLFIALACLQVSIAQETPSDCLPLDCATCAGSARGVIQDGYYCCGVTGYLCFDLSDCPSPPNPDDVKALTDLYDATNGPQWTNKEGWVSNSSICTWSGIACDENNRVIDLDLSQNNLRGTIPESIGNLAAMVQMDLSENKLTGSIPDSIGKLEDLGYLDLHENQLTGSIPDSIGESGATSFNWSLDLSYNQLTGTIPDSIGELTALVQLDFGSNKLTGTIPDSIDKLEAINYLDLSHNQFTAWSGDDFCKLFSKDLRGCEMNNNSNIACPVPACAASCKVTCKAPGPAPPPQRCAPTDNQDDCKALCDLYDATNGPEWNNKEGWVSGSSMCTWSGVKCTWSSGEWFRVTQLALDDHNLNGSIPSTIGKLEYMTDLDLSFNNLNGSIPDSIGQLTHLTDLALDRNGLTGTIPDSIGKLTALKHLLLLQNKLTGTIPDSIGNLTALTSMELHNNQLTGAIPDSEGWKELVNLTYLDLSYNHFTSWSGHGFCNLTFPYLTDCNMNNESFICPLPACAAACKATCKTGSPSSAPTNSPTNSPTNAPSPAIPTSRGSKSKVPIVMGVIGGIFVMAIVGYGGYKFTRRSGASEQQIQKALQQADTEEGSLPYALVEPGQETVPANVRPAAEEAYPSIKNAQSNHEEGLDTNLLASTAPDSVGRRATNEIL